MQRQIATTSYLPSILLPCPYCGSRLVVKAIEPDPIERDLENITHGCTRCGTELTRTVWQAKAIA